MPSPRPLMTEQTAADIHDIATCLKLMTAQQMVRPGIPFDDVLGQLFGGGGYENMKRFLDQASRTDPGTGELRAVA